MLCLISIGLITSLCLPLVNSGSLAGVTCTDILLKEIFSDFTNFQQGELSYAFMIDGQGRVMVHYLQPTPKAITDDPDPIDIYTLETNPAEVTMIESMKRYNRYTRYYDKNPSTKYTCSTISCLCDWLSVPFTNISLMYERHYCRCNEEFWSRWKIDTEWFFIVE